MDAVALAPVMMIASGSIHAVVNAILKGGKDKMAGRAVIDGSSALLLLPATLLVPLPHGAWGWLIATALLHCVYLYALVRAFETSDFSAAYPVMRGTAPLVTAALAMGLFGEPASARELAGIALIGTAMFLMVTSRHISRAGLGWALFTGVTIAGYTVIDANGVRAAPTPFSFIVWLFVLMGAATVTMFALFSKRCDLRICTDAVACRRGGGRAFDPHLWTGAFGLRAGPDRAARRSARDGHGHRARHRHLRARRAGDARAPGCGTRHPRRCGADPHALRAKQKGRTFPPGPFVIGSLVISCPA